MKTVCRLLWKALSIGTAFCRSVCCACIMLKYCIDNDYHLNKFSTKTILIQMIIIIVYLNPCNQYV